MSPFARTLTFALLTLVAGCRHTSIRICHARVEDQRARVSRLQWSRVDLSGRLNYDNLPQGAGRLVPWGFVSTAAVDGTLVEVFENVHPAEQNLERWVAVEGDRHTILHPQRSEDDPVYLMASRDTKVSLLRRVIKALEPFAIIRLVVRPTTYEEPAWRPSPEGQAMFHEATRKPHDARHFDAWRAALLSSAAGCPKALDLVNLPGMVGSQRLPLLADIFESCACAGDMETLAALYWWSTFLSSRPARWLPWDPAVAAQLGDDATYEQLVRALIARETNPIP